MRPFVRGLATLSSAVLLVACGGATPTPAPTAAPTSGPVATIPPATSEPPAETQMAKVCEETTAATDVETSVGGFAWGSVTAKVGDVVTWTNGDDAPHKLAFDDGTCTMDGNIDGGGGTRSLTFSKAGTFAFHCTLHGQMPGSITITE
ncbi:MAG TPA: plastocyanin/azurin family copper-binding protein [Candidatus Limnocylindria bacterium]|nr:plastocyanin/azurin family copper-binding protein [Candidatus Limnocylindria bacterium]